MNKGDFLGKTQPLKATFDHQVDAQQLRQPLEAGAVVRIFCQGCGHIYGLNQADALRLLSLLEEKKEIESFAGYYFHAQACAYCDSENDSVELRLIPKE